MDTCTPQLALAIQLAKVLSVSLTQGRDDISQSHTHSFFREFREALEGEMPTRVLRKFLFFQTRVSVLPYNHLSVQQQEYALILTVLLLSRKPESLDVALLYKTCKLVLSVVSNLAMYLQKGEFVTVEEQESWRRSEDLLLSLLRFLCANEPLPAVQEACDLEGYFGAYFLGFDGVVPEDFDSDLTAAARPLADKQPPLLQHAHRLLVEDMLAYKPFLLYVSEFLKNNCEDTRLCLYLLRLLAFKAGSKVSIEALAEAYSEAFSALRSWSLAQDNLPTVCELTLAFCRVHLGEKPLKQLRAKILAEVSRRLYENECYFKTQGADLFPDTALYDLCSLMIEFLQQQTEQTAKPTKAKPSLALQGYGQSHFSEPETQTEEYCTYHRTGTEFELQHWYYCYTCDLVENKGACSVCARKCHRGHDVVYSRKGNFFCDCGDSRSAGGCQSLPKKLRASQLPVSRQHFLNRMKSMKSSDSEEQLHDFLTLSQGRLGRDPDVMFVDLEHGENMYFGTSPRRGTDMDEDLEEIHSGSEEDKKESEDKDSSESSAGDEEMAEKVNEPPSSSDSSEEESDVAQQAPVKQRANSLQLVFGEEAKDLCTAECLVSLCLRTLDRLQSPPPPQVQVDLFTSKVVEVSKAQVQSVCSYKACSVPRLSHEERDAKDAFPSLKNVIAYCKSLDLILLAEGNKLHLIDSSLVRASGNDLDRSQMTILLKHTLTFPVTSLVINPAFPRMVAVHGVTECVGLVLCDRSRRGLIKTKVTLAAGQDQGSTYPIIKAQWIVGSQCELAIATCHDVRIFNLAKETLCPLYCFIAYANDITDLCMVAAECPIILASCGQGVLYRQAITSDLEGAGQVPITSSVVLPAALEAKAIISISYLPALSCFALSLSDYKLVLAAMDLSYTYITSYFELALNADPGVALNFRHTSALVNMQVASTGTEVVLVGVARKTHSFPVLIKLTSEACILAPLRKSSAYLDGIALYSNADKDYVLCHSEDGAILCLQTPKPQRVSEQPSSELLNSWLQVDHLPESVTMQTSFFERCVSLNIQKQLGPPTSLKGEVTLSGDPVLIFGSSKVALEKLSYDRNTDPIGLSSSVLPDPRAISVGVGFEGPALLLAGVKCFVEAAAGGHIEFLNRKFKLNSASKRWYDIPLCDVEIVKVHLQGRLNMRFVSVAKAPLKLFYFEVFAITSANFNLDQKLQEVAKAVLVATGGPEKASEYKLITDWKLRQPLLAKCEQSQQLLLAEVMALGQVLPRGEVNLEVCSLISRLFEKSLLSGNALFRTAAKDALKRLLEVQGKQHSYALIKTLHLSWMLITSGTADDLVTLKVIKHLSAFAKDNFDFFAYILSQFPLLLTCLFSRIKAQRSSLTTALDHIVRVSIGAIQLIANKAIFDMQLTATADILQAAYLLPQGLFQEPCQVLCELLTYSVAEIRRSAALSIYKALKKKSRSWLKQVKEANLPISSTAFTSLLAIYRGENTDLPTRLHSLLSHTGADSHLSILVPDVAYTVLYWSSGLTPSLEVKVDSSVGLTCKLLKALEKQWVQEDIIDVRYFERIAEVIVAQMQALSVEAISEQLALFLRLVNALISYEEQSESSHSSKMSPKLLSVLLSVFPKEAISIAHQKITEWMSFFISGRGSIKADYKGQVAVGVVETRDKLETVQVEREYLTENWDVVMDCKADLYEELDQFVMVNLMDFVYNIVNGWKECPPGNLRKLRDLVCPAMMQTEGNSDFQGLQQPWMSLFCTVFYEPVFAFARPATQRVFRLLFASDSDFHRALDSNQYSNELTKLVTLASQTHFFLQVFQYEETVVLTAAIKSICVQVCKRPINWKLHFLDVNSCIDEILPVQVMLRSAFNLPEGTSSACLALIAVLFEETPEAESLLGCSMSVQALDQPRAWGQYTEDYLPLLIDLLLLESTWTSVRKAAGALLKGLLTFASQSQRSSIVAQVFSRVQHLPPYGACTDVFLQILAHILKLCQVPEALQANLLEDVIKAVEKYSILLDSRQNCEVYEHLKDLLSSGSQRPGFCGYILEPEPCVRCFEAQIVPFLPYKVQDLQAEMKFSDSCQFLKLKDIYTISEITVSMADARGHKAVRSCSVYINNRDVADLTELKSNWSQWAKVATTKVNPAASGVIRIEFAVPVTALNLVIEYQTINVLRAQGEENSLFPNKYFGRSRYTFISTQRFDSRGEIIGYSIGSEREVLPCPRCNKTVEDRHGICSCGENVYQCIQCRNINYEKLDAFLCNECGVSRYCKLEINFMARPGMACEGISSQKSSQTAELKVEKLLEGIQAYFDGLEKVQDQTLSLIRRIQRVAPAQEKTDDAKVQPILRALNPAVTTLASLYGKDYKSSYQSMIKSVKSVNALRREILRYRKQDLGVADHYEMDVNCYGCVHGFILNALLFLQELEPPSEVGVTIVESVFRHCLLSPAREVRQAARKALHQLTRNSFTTLSALYRLIDQHLSAVLGWGHFPVDVIREDVELVLQSCAYEANIHEVEGDSGRWETAMRFFWKMFFLVLRQSWVNGALAEFVPGFLELISQMILKNLVLERGTIPAVSPDLQQFILENPALITNVENSTNSHDYLVAWLLSPDCSPLYTAWQSEAVSFTTWQESHPSAEADLQIPANNWLMQCLLRSTSQKAQDLAKGIYLSLAWTHPRVWRAVFEVVLSSLEEALRTCRQGGDYYFALLEALVVPDCPLSALERLQLLSRLLKSVEKEVEQLVKVQERQECMGVCMVKISLGHGLDCLLEFLSTMASKELLSSSRELTHSILNSYLGIMKLAAIKNKVIAESQSFLKKLFDLLREDSTDTGPFLRECVIALHNRKGDLLAQSLLCELILHIVNPERPPATYYLHLDKTPTQEEFIRGNMEKNPYSSKELGPLIKHVRERICKELELTDPELLELLVADSIVGPDLSIISVYEKVLWPVLQQTEPKFESVSIHEVPQDELPNMTVIYRLIGLDGEATENRIDALPGDDEGNEDFEGKSQATALLSEVIEGSCAMKDLLQLVSSDREQFLQPALDLLVFSCRLKANRATLLALGGASVLVNKLSERTSNECLEKVLLVLEAVVMDEQAAQMMDLGAGVRQHVVVAVTALQDRLERKSAVTKSITRILPFLCCGSSEAMQDLYGFFKPFMQYEGVEGLSARDRSYFDAWVELLSFLPPSNHSFRSFLLEAGLTASLCQLFSHISPEDLKTRSQFTRPLLVSLASLVKGHPQSQTTLQHYGVITKVYQLSQEYSKDLGSLCETLIESITGRTDSESRIRTELLEMIQRDKEARSVVANSKREEALKELKGDSAMLDFDVDEEPGLACVVCMEGYTLRPEAVLGIYVYSKPVMVSAAIESIGSDSSDMLRVYSLVTHFNCIHLACHEQAARAERNMKKPKPEWEGATIRNQHTKCNNWFPIKGPAITEDVYALAVERLCGGYEGLENKARNAVHDLRIMLHRFAVEESFSREAKGGGPEHNLQIVPYMVQLALHLLAQDTAYNAALVSKKERFVNEMPTAGVTLEQFEFCLTLLLLYAHPTCWTQVKPRLPALCAAVANDKTSLHSKRQFCKDQQASGAKSALVLVHLVDLFFQHCYGSIASVPETEWSRQLQAMLGRSDQALKDQCLEVFELYKTCAGLSTVEETVGLIGWDAATASLFRPS